ncbi:MAG: MFS transporter [Clostridia bacterium]|nr:MFS transporter [Oscillospiraceae bacterium]MBQ6701712.1 MFS transporter [Clostridia bacterium]
MDNQKESLFGYTPEQYKKFKKHAWLMLLSFGLTYLFFYNGRQNINLVLDSMEKEFGSGAAAMGLVTSALFWCYAFGQLISGRLGAYFGYKKFMIFGIVSSAAINVIISFQTNITVIAILWGLNGFCQSTVWANGLGVLNKWWPKKQRGFASGLATAFTGLAQVVTYLTINWCLILTPDWGWRAAFRFPMIPMVLILIAFIFFFKTSPEDVGLPAFKEEDSALDAQEDELAQRIKTKNYFYPYKLLFGQPKIIVFCLISAIAGIGRYGLLTWIPKYFSEEMGLTVNQSIMSTILLPIGHACAMFLFPFLTDKVFKGKREPMLIIASIITFFGMISFPFIKDQLLASIMLFVVGVSCMVTGVVWAIAGDMGGRTLSSTVVGILDWAVYMGAALQSALFGYVIESSWGWTGMFITIGALYVALLVLTLFARKMKMKKM